MGLCHANNFLLYFTRLCYEFYFFSGHVKRCVVLLILRAVTYAILFNLVSVFLSSSFVSFTSTFTMYIHHYILPINTTSLLLFHPSFSSLSFTPPSSPSPSHHPAPSSSSENESTPPVIVQVRIKPANQKIIDELAIFYLNQFEITVRPPYTRAYHTEQPISISHNNREQ